MVRVVKPPVLEPYFAVIGTYGFIRGMAQKPGSRQYIVADVSAYKFGHLATFEYYKGAESLWIDGMQKWAATDVSLVTDGESDGIFIMYCMHKTSCLVFLGRLDNDCKLYGFAIESFEKFTAKL